MIKWILWDAEAHMEPCTGRTFPVFAMSRLGLNLSVGCMM